MNGSSLTHRILGAPRLVAILLVMALIAALSSVSLAPAQAADGVHKISVIDASAQEGNTHNAPPATGQPDQRNILRVPVRITPAPDPANIITVKYRIVLRGEGLPYGTARPSTGSGTPDRVPNDYDTVGGTLVFPAGSTEQFIDIPLNGDTHAEPAETIFIKLFEETNADIADADGVATIENDDLPSPRLVVSNNTTDEPDLDADNNPVATNATFTFSLDKASTQEVTVRYDITAGSPPATAGDDFTAPTGDNLVRIPAGQTSTTLAIKINGDVINEFDEVYNLTLSDDNNAIVDKRIGIGTIRNTDPEPKFSIVEANPAQNDPDKTEVRQNEGEPDEDGNNTVTKFNYVVRLTDGHPDRAGQLTTSGKGARVVATAQETTGTNPADDPSDFDARSETLDFGTTVSTQPFAVDVVGDNTVEPTEHFAVVLSQASRATIAGSRATGVIVDDDGLGPRVTVTAKDTDPAVDGIQSVYKEGASGTTAQAKFIVSIPTPPAGPEKATVNYRTILGPPNSSANSDDVQATTGTIEWLPTDTTLTREVSIPINGDGLDESDETFFIELEAAKGVTLGSNVADRRSAPVTTIQDDDCLAADAPNCPVLTVSSQDVTEPDAPATLPENRATMTFTISLSPASGQSVTVTPTLENGTATGGAGQTNDYTVPPTNAPITFAPGETTKTYNVTVNGDNDPEPDETFKVRLANVSGANSPPALGVGTILNDDGAAPAISIGDAPAINEGNSGVTNSVFTINRTTAATTQEVRVFYATVDGTAKADKGTNDKYDYEGSSEAAPKSVVFGTGQTTATINIPVNGDTAKENNETFSVRLLSATNATISEAPGADVGTGTITNDDTAPLKVSVGDAQAATETEEGTGGELTFPVTLASRPGEAISVKYSTADGTAKAGSDYTAKTGTLTWAADEAPTKTVTVAVLKDTTDEPDENLTLVLSEPSATAAVEDGSGTGTIVDNDSPPSATINDPTASEGATKATFTVTLSAASGNAVKIDFATQDGTATQPGDYTTTTTQLVFAAGETSKTVDVPVAQDTTEEDDETFLGKISSPDGSATIAKDSGTATIQDDDGAARPTLSVSDESAAEGNSATKTLDFDVTLSGASSKTVTVNYTTEDGTATAADDDYEPTNGTLTFTPGQTTKVVPVTINGDTKSEPNEKFLLKLSGEGNATVADAVGEGTITSDEAPPVVAEITTGPGPGGGPHVRSYTDTSGNERRGFMLGDSDEGFGATVARGDVDPTAGDEIITGTNDGPPVVRIWSANGQFLDAVQIFEDEYDGGISVAAGNFDDDAADELVAASGPGNESRLAIFEINGDVVDILDEYAPYGAFTGGVFVAAGDIDGDGKDDIATGPGPGGGPHVKVWFDKGNSDEFFPYPAAFAGGVRVAIGSDANENYLVTGAGPGGGPHAGVFDYTTTAKPGQRHEVSGFYAYDARVSSGISVAVGDIDGDDVLDIVTGAGPGGGPHVQGFSPSSQHKGGFFAYACNAATFPRDCFTNGVWVALGRA